MLLASCFGRAEVGGRIDKSSILWSSCISEHEFIALILYKECAYLMPVVEEGQCFSLLPL